MSGVPVGPELPSRRSGPNPARPHWWGESPPPVERGPRDPHTYIIPPADEEDEPHGGGGRGGLGRRPIQPPERKPFQPPARRKPWQREDGTTIHAPRSGGTTLML